MTQQATVPLPENVEDVAQCRHYWVIQPATGPMSQGICQSCGEVKEFKNYVEAATWGDSRTAGHSDAEGAEAVSRVVAGHLDNEVEE